MIGEDVAEREATGEGGDGGRERQRQTKRVNRSDKDRVTKTENNGEERLSLIHI